MPKIWAGARAQRLGRRGVQNLGEACPISGNHVSRIWARCKIIENANPTTKISLCPKVAHALPKRRNKYSGRSAQMLGARLPQILGTGGPQILGARAPQLLGVTACANSGSCRLKNSWKSPLSHISGIACPGFEITSLLDFETFTLCNFKTRHLSAICIWGAAWI